MWSQRNGASSHQVFCGLGIKNMASVIATLPTSTIAA